MRKLRQVHRIFLSQLLALALLTAPIQLWATDPVPPSSSESGDNSKPADSSEYGGEAAEGLDTNGESEDSEKPRARTARMLVGEVRDMLEQHNASTRQMIDAHSREIQEAADDRRRSRKWSRLGWTACGVLLAVGGAAMFFVAGGGGHPQADSISIEKRLNVYDTNHITKAERVMKRKVSSYRNPDGSFSSRLEADLVVFGAVVRAELQTKGSGKVPNGLWRVLAESDADGSISAAANDADLVDGELIGENFGNLRDFLKHTDEDGLKKFDKIFARALLIQLKTADDLSKGLYGAEANPFDEMTLEGFLFNKVMPIAELGAGASPYSNRQLRNRSGSR